MLRVTPETRVRLDEQLTRVMVGLSFLFLVILAAAIPLVEQLVEQPQLSEETLRLFGLALLGIMPFFVIEFVVHYLIRDRGRPFWGEHWDELLVCFIPPLRLTANWHGIRERIWIPFLGWQTAGRELRQRLEKFFSVPMIVIGLLILPVLAFEFLWVETVRATPWLALTLAVSTSVIWLAFAVEFIVLFAVAESKLIFCRDHWLDLAIILLPVLAFLRGMRLLRLLRLARVDQLGRLYRFRAVLVRIIRALVLLELLHRLFERTPEQRLQRLERRLAGKEAEVEELRQEIAKLRAEIETRKRVAEAAIETPDVHESVR